MYEEGLASKLKHARENWSFTQQYVADELKVNRSTITCYETGKRKPDIETLGKLIDFYQVKASWLLGTRE